MKFNAPRVAVVVVVGAMVVVVGAVVVGDAVVVVVVVVVVAVVLVVVGAVVVVVPLGVTGDGPMGRTGTGAVVGMLVTGAADVVEVVLATVVVVTLTTGVGASRTKNSPRAVPLPTATSSKPCDSATWPVFGASQSFSLKLPAEQGRDGSSLWCQASATRWQAEAKRTLPTIVVHPPLADSSHGLARASRTSGRMLTFVWR